MEYAVVGDSNGRQKQPHWAEGKESRLQRADFGVLFQEIAELVLAVYWDLVSNECALDA